MALYDSRLIKKQEVADGTMEFVLEKPSGLEYRAGQFFDIILEGKPDAEKSTYVHGFSFVSAPYEDYVAAATRMRGSAFKNAIKALPEGSPIKVEAVWGEFFLPRKTTTPIVFLIGGIGITPVMSMLKQATHDETGHKITLIYANTNPARAAFIDELRELEKANPGFTLVTTFSQPDDAKPGDEQGRVDGAMIKRHVDNLDEPLWYLSGPPGMVRAMRETLVSIGADEDNIRTEEFDGY